MKQNIHILIFSILILTACSGSRKYFKAAEKLEKQGLVNEAAEYYLESLQRKPTNVNARIKLKEVGQKHVSNMASEFFRNYNTQQLEASLSSFEKLQDFNSKAKALSVDLDYPKTYDEDYQKGIETYCSKNQFQAQQLVVQKKYKEAVPYIERVKKYNASYKNIQQIDVLAFCEPLYQSAINNLENKNYAAALSLLSTINTKSENYKDAKDLLELSTAQQTKSFILFEPKPSGNPAEKEIEDYLYENFSQIAGQKLSSLRIINNTPFQSAATKADFNNSTNIDLIQAIRKATSADYFYVYDVQNKQETNSGLNKTVNRGFQEFKTVSNNTLVTTTYQPFDYNVVRAQRSFSFDYKYKLINAYTNQIVAAQTQNVRGTDAIEYQEFHHQFSGNINNLYPYNPAQTAVLAQYNARNWRGLFSARSTLKDMSELRTNAYNQALNVFINSASGMK